MRLTPSLLLLLLHAAAAAAAAGSVFPPATFSGGQQPLDPGDFTAAPNTVPALPVPQAPNDSACRLDLSAELFGGVGEACGRSLDRSRCCPVLAAWLFAAHARSALELAPDPPQPQGDDAPMVPYDNQRCVDALQGALERRDVLLQKPNASCDTVLCFCGIRLHQIGSLRCPAAFTVAAGARNATPTPAVRDLERTCRNASYAGCSRCVQSLKKVKGHNVEQGSGGDGRASRMLGRDCQLMGLTWLLARNKTAYIPTVSAVLRALLYSAHPIGGAGGGAPRCSPDQENMPLAVDSLQFQRLGEASSAHGGAPVVLLLVLLYSCVAALVFVRGPL